jgi:hypothetical protein
MSVVLPGQLFACLRSLNHGAGRYVLAAAVIAWVAVSAYLWQQLFAHTYRATPTRAAVVAWPADTPLPRAQADFQVVLFAHPLCPCTRATLAELHQSLARTKPRSALTFVFVTAGLRDSAVAKSDTLARARSMPEGQVLLDEDGSVARQFGATISGEVMVFNREGQRVYRGGLTAGRGHQGDSAAQTLFEQIIAGGDFSSVEAPVFGCRLAVP